MRSDLIMAHAAKYSEPDTPEFLLFCHLFASFAWTPEDLDKKNFQITGDRKQLLTTLRTLKAEALNLKGQVKDKRELAQQLLAHGVVRGQLVEFIPRIVNNIGEYRTKGEGEKRRLVVGKEFYRPSPVTKLRAALDAHT